MGTRGTKEATHVQVSSGGSEEMYLVQGKEQWLRFAGIAVKIHPTPQEEGKVVLYSHLFKDFPQFIAIHTVKGFGIVSKAEIDVF